MNEKNFSQEFYEKWERLISSCEIHDVPIQYISQVSAHFKNGKTTVFDIKAMLFTGATTGQIENMIENYLEEHDSIIDKVDFHINIENIANEVDKKTTNLLDKK